MTNHVIAAALNESLFGSLPETVLRDLELTSRITRVPSGKLVYNPEVSVIVDGALRAFVDDGAARHLTVSYMYRPQSIGIAGAAGQEFPVGYQAIVPSTILRISRARFDELLQTHCQIGWAATRELARQLDDVLDETVRVAFHPVRARIAHHLLALTDIDHEEHALFTRLSWRQRSAPCVRSLVGMLDLCAMPVWLTSAKQGSPPSTKRVYAEWPSGEDDVANVDVTKVRPESLTGAHPGVQSWRHDR